VERGLQQIQTCSSYGRLLKQDLESLEKYYNKTDDSPITIVSMCKWFIVPVPPLMSNYFNPDLNPCLKTSNLILHGPQWPEASSRIMEKVVCRILLSTNLLADRHIYQFDKYQKAYKAESSWNPDPTAPLPLHAQHQVAWLKEQHRSTSPWAKIFKWHACQINKVPCGESALWSLCRFSQTSGRGDSAMVKVGHSAAGLLSTSLICSYYRTCYHYPVLSRIALDYLSIQDQSVHASTFFLMRASQDTKCCARLLPKTSVPFRLSKANTRRAEMPQATNWCKWAVEKNRWMDDSIVEVRSRSQWWRQCKFSR